MSTVISFADLTDLDRDEEVRAHHLDMLTQGDVGLYVVQTVNSHYTVQVHGENGEGYRLATVHCPTHPLTGAPAAIMFDVVYRILDGRLLVVDDEDVRRVLFRSSTIRDVYCVSR